MEVHVCYETERGISAHQIASSILWNEKWYACAMTYSLEVIRYCTGSSLEMSTLVDTMNVLKVTPVDILLHLEAADRFEHAVGFALQRYMRTIFEKWMEKDVWYTSSGLHHILQKEIETFGTVKSLEAALADEHRLKVPMTHTHLPEADLRPFWRRLLPLVRLRTDMLGRQLGIGAQRTLMVLTFHFFFFKNKKCLKMQFV